MKGRGVPFGYVEGLNEARTPLADFFSILLNAFAQQGLILIQWHQVWKQHEQLRTIFRLNEALVFEEV
jgi:hypothetical protein